jgi:hypothetical protein
LAGVLVAGERPASAATPTLRRANLVGATSSRAARSSALRSIPFDQLDEPAKAKVRSVLSKVSVFRRMPVRVIDCDPNLYLFLVRHPDVVVNIWEELKLTQLGLSELEGGGYRFVEPDGMVANVEYLYCGHDTHVIYATGTYDGPLFAKPVRGRALMVLKSGYVQETDGRHYITTRLDTFLSVDHGGVELLTKTFHPLLGKTADVNFIQTVAFLGSLSRTAEVNARGVQRLASRLSGVRPELRTRLAVLAAGIAKGVPVAHAEPAVIPTVAGHAVAESTTGSAEGKPVRR